MGVGERWYGTCPPHAERVVAMMMCRQRVAATKIDSPVMAVSGRHLRLEHGKVCDTDEVDGDPHILQFLSRWHTQTGEVAMMHRWEEIDQREGSGTRSAGHGTVRVLHDAKSCHPTTQPPTPTAIRPHLTRFQIQMRQLFIEIVVPALRCRT
jgi:hypothetical protein